MQKILSEGPLLTDGKLTEAGYATSAVKTYDRSMIPASKWRIKEWDYYAVTDGENFFAFTIADLGYISLVSASFVDCREAQYKTTSDIGFFPFGKLNLPPTPDTGEVLFKDGRVMMKFENDGSTRRILCNFKNFQDKKTLEAELTLSEFPRDAMVIATPFPNAPAAFYYNAKVNCMRASGYAKIGDDLYLFDSDRALATLDWGRGVWTYKNTWYWASLSAYEQGKRIGFNLGYGFGDASAASENMFFIDGIAHKLGEVVFEIPEKDGKFDYLSPWRIHDADGRLTLDFTPIVNRADCTNLGIIVSDQNQIFGKFSGKVVLDDYSTLTFREKIGFAERVYNKW